MKHSSLVCLFGRNGSGKTRMLQRIEGLFSEGEVLRTGAETVMSGLVSGFAEHRSIDEICAPFLKAETLLIDNLWVLASRPKTAAVVCELVQRRMADDRFTVLASDLSLRQWADRQPEMAALLGQGMAVQL